MTNAEAIETLRANYPDACYEQLRCAVDMAIKALEKQEQLANNSPELDNNIGDLISRQAAIDAILAVTGNSSVRELYEHVQEHGLSEMWSGGVNAAIDIIIAVPPVQPKKRTETHGVCLDAIDRQAAIDALDKRFDSIPMEQTTEILLLRKDLRELPPTQPEVLACGEGELIAQPEIVRCKDCRYFKDITSIHGECESADMWQSLFGEVTEVEAIEVHKDHYCGYAERKTDEKKNI